MCVTCMSLNVLVHFLSCFIYQLVQRNILEQFHSFSLIHALGMVCGAKDRMVVVLERKTYIHDLAQLTVLDTIDTISNPRGIFSKHLNLPPLQSYICNILMQTHFFNMAFFFFFFFFFILCQLFCRPDTFVDLHSDTAGLCALSPNQENCYLALPASATSGSVLVYDTLDLHALCQVRRM